MGLQKLLMMLADAGCDRQPRFLLSHLLIHNSMPTIFYSTTLCTLFETPRKAGNPIKIGATLICKVHWFRSHLNSSMQVQKVDTKEQLGDLFTKPLARDAFQCLCGQLMGWQKRAKPGDLNAGEGSVTLVLWVIPPLLRCR